MKNCFKKIIKKLNRNVFCENDANCFTFQSQLDGYNIVFGVILGSDVEEA